MRSCHNAAFSRNQMSVWEGRAAVASVAFYSTAADYHRQMRPRRSVARQIGRKHSRTMHTSYAVKLYVPRHTARQASNGTRRIDSDSIILEIFLSYGFDIKYSARIKSCSAFSFSPFAA